MKGDKYYFVTDRDMKWPHVHQPVMALTPNQLEAFVASFGVKKNRDPQASFFVFPFLSFVNISFFLLFHENRRRE